MTKKVLTIVGARPQFVKAAALSQAFSDADDFDELIVHTGQHYDSNMSGQFFKQLNIPEPIALSDNNRGTPATFIGNTISGLDRVISQHKPDLLLVYGDTNSTLAGAVAANANGIALAHVEAGLRSFNRGMPEEHNRVVTDHLSDILLCPSHSAMKNLNRENIVTSQNRKVEFVGDIMFDALKLFSPHAEAPVNVENLDNFVLVTLHRPVNVDNKQYLISIIDMLAEMASKREVIWPLHPRTAQRLKDFQIDVPPQIRVIEPAPYLAMLYLLQHCDFVVTDSGGLQKEAYFSGKPCCVVRDETEWMELVELEQSLLIGNGAANRNSIDSFLNLKGTTDFQPPYGDGQTRFNIVDVIRDFFL